jgi:hypothetical protein
MLKRVVAIFDATQKSANLLERWPEMAPGYLEGMTAWVIRYRSLRGENRSMSAMPRKRRLAVKASSVAMGHERTHAPQR